MGGIKVAGGQEPCDQCQWGVGGSSGGSGGSRGGGKEMVCICGMKNCFLSM